MKKIIFFLLIIGNFSIGQNCSKSLKINEVDKFKNERIVESDHLTFDQPTISTFRDISFLVNREERFFARITCSSRGWQVGSEISFLFSNGEVAKTKISVYEYEKSGTEARHHFLCQLENRDQLEYFYAYKLEKIRVECVNKTYDISSKKQGKISALARCTIEAIGIDNVNYDIMPIDLSTSDGTVVVFNGGGTTITTSGTVTSKDGCDYSADKTDDLTGQRIQILNSQPLSESNQAFMGYIGKIDQNYYFFIENRKKLGCVGQKSSVMLLLSNSDTLDFQHEGPSSCEEGAMFKVNITNSVDVLKSSAIQSLVLTYDDMVVEFEMKNIHIVSRWLNECF